MRNQSPTRIFAVNIRYLRIKHQLSLSEMAAIIGISVSTLRRLEMGMSSVRTNCVMLNRICDHFDISADAMIRERLEELEA